VKRFPIHPWHVFVFVGVLLIGLSIFRVGQATRVTVSSECDFDRSRALSGIAYFEARQRLSEQLYFALGQDSSLSARGAIRKYGAQISKLDQDRLSYLRTHVTASVCAQRAQETF
jgi:hypothetical protein